MDNLNNIKKNKNYLSNKEMFAELKKCQDEGVISDKIGKMIMLLANRYATKPNFRNYSYKDQMISAGVLSCVNAFYKFDREKGENCFAYFTACIHNAFLQQLHKERKQQEIRDKLLVDHDMNPSSGYIERHKDDVYEGNNDPE